MPLPKRKILGKLGIDFNDVEQVNKLPLEVVSRRRLCYWMGWKVRDANDVLEQLTVFEEVPLACQGKNCPFSSRCPLCRNGTVKKWASVHAPCPIEIVEAFRHLVGYVTDLNISPEDYPDIQVLNDLIRIQIQMRRCDLQLAEEGMTEKYVGAIAQKSAQTFDRRVQNEVITAQRNLRRDFDTKLKNLLATREAKLREKAVLKDTGRVDLSDIKAILDKKEDKKEIKSDNGLPLAEPITPVEEEEQKVRRLEF